MKTNDLLKVLLTMLVGIIVLLYIPAIFIKISNWPLLGGFTLSVWIVLSFTMIFVYYPPKHFLVKPKKDPEPPVLENSVKPAQETPTVTELASLDNNPFIVKGAKGQPITVGGKPATLYSWRDFQFNLDIVPHTLLAASSGSGKSTALFNLLHRVNQQYNRPKIILCDAGNFDFPEAIAYDQEDIIKVVRYLYLVMRGRQSAREQNATRLIWVLEEAEAFMASIDLLSKKEKDIVITMLANFGRLARKTRINAIFVNQKAGANEFPTVIRDNFNQRLILRGPNNLSTTLGCPFDTTNLPVGVAFNTNAGAFIQFDLIEKPPLNLVSMTELAHLARAYRRKFNLTDPWETLFDG